MNPSDLRWAIVVIELDPTRGREQEGVRRALVVSCEAFHRSGMATVCPISARDPKYPGEVSIPSGHAGQTKDGAILCHQVRTVDLSRVKALELGGRVQHVTDSGIRSRVRDGLLHQLGLDIAASTDGAA